MSQSQSPAPIAMAANPNPNPSPNLCAPDFSRMSLSEIMALNLTVRELTDFDLVGRFVVNHRSSMYIQNILTALSQEVEAETIESETLSMLIDYLLRPANRIL